MIHLRILPASLNDEEVCGVTAEVASRGQQQEKE